MSDSDWGRGLRRPDAYPHPVTQIDLIETHISWIVLTGTFAYKIKKPVYFGFLDFSTLELRRFYCHEELRLNSRLAPDLYLRVVPITGTSAQPHLDGSGEAIEYAIQMRQFDNVGLFNRLVQKHRLFPEYLDHLAEILADFHAAIDRATVSDPMGQAQQCWEASEQNFIHIRSRLDCAEDRAQLKKLQHWSEDEYQRCYAIMQERHRQGFIRECHGDLHLGNIVLRNGHPTPFDGIEFNENLRWIDVISELAFLVMDLEVKGQFDLAVRFLNRYLELTGDYSGLILFDYYRLYRAMVRVKIALITLDEEPNPKTREELQAQYRRYIEYGLGLIRPHQPLLVMTHGYSGSGKSYLAALLAERLWAIHLRSDIERKRLAGLAPRTVSFSALNNGLYTAEMTHRTYRHLLDLAETLLRAKYSVIIDATFLQQEQRERVRYLAMRQNAPLLVLDCRAPIERLRERIKSRIGLGNDPSEADIAVLERQITEAEPLTKLENDYTLSVQTDESLDLSRLLGEILWNARRVPSSEFSETDK
jgi:aminoglycoside phosphotransferase family enzyme/predicted kinase